MATCDAGAHSALRRRASAGFTYIGVMVLVALIGLAAATSVQCGALLQRRAAEQALLDTGRAYRAALASYAGATPVGQPRAPRTLQALLRDPRYPNVRRHLRRLYPDPITGRSEWGLLTGADGGIIGVYSLSNARPIKIGHFDADEQAFEGKTAYREWRFVAVAQIPAGTPEQNTRAGTESQNSAEPVQELKQHPAGTTPAGNFNQETK